MPFSSSIARSAKPVIGRSGVRNLPSADQKNNANIYRNVSISVTKGASRSAGSFLKKVLRSIAGKLSSLFKGKRTMTVQRYVPAANAGSAFEQYRAAKRNGLSFETRRPAEPLHRDVAHAQIAETLGLTEPLDIGSTEPASMPVEEGVANVLPDSTVESPSIQASLEAEAEAAPAEAAPLQDDAASVEVEEAFHTLTVRERAAIIDARTPAAPSPRSAFMQGMLFNRETPEAAHSQTSEVPRPEGYTPLRNFRGELYSGTGGRFNIRGTGIAHRTEFHAPVLFEHELPGAWPLRPPPGSYFAPPVPVEIAAAAWYAPEKEAEIEAAWRDIAPQDDPKVKLFSEYLVRLGNAELNDCLMGDVADFRKFVQEWLMQVSRSPELFAQTLEVVHDGNESCDDRVFLTFNRLQTPRVLDDVNNGKYTGRLSDLITAGRRQFRAEKLQQEAFTAVEARVDKIMQSQEICDKIAAAGDKAETVWKELRESVLEGSEELETHLSMQIDNAEALDMDPPIKNMRFRASAKLTDEERSAAVERVKEKENLDVAEWLSDWPPFNTFMENQYPAEYKEFAARKDEIADELPQKIASEVAADIERMQEAGALPKDLTISKRNALEIRLTNEKWHRSGAAAMHLAMQDFTNKVGHPGIVDPRWPSAA